MSFPALFLVTLFFLGGCGPSEHPDDGLADAGALVDATPTVDAAPMARADVIYAHDPGYLYTMDPTSFTLTLVGAFIYPDEYDQMTDIAVDQHGGLYGVSFSSLYQIDPETAFCTRLGYLADEFNGLSFLPAGTFDPDHETLVATAVDGKLWRIDLTNGHQTFIGSFGDGLGSSGDVVSVEGFGTVAAVLNAADGMVWLATIDPTTATATLLHSTGLTSIWGLAFWRGQLYGFSPNGNVTQLDPQSATVTLLHQGSVSWWGAAVTTSAPVIP